MASSVLKGAISFLQTKTVISYFTGLHWFASLPLRNVRLCDTRHSTVAIVHSQSCLRFMYLRIVRNVKKSWYVITTLKLVLKLVLFAFIQDQGQFSQYESNTMSSIESMWRLFSHVSPLFAKTPKPTIKMQTIQYKRTHFNARNSFFQNQITL